MSYDMVAETKPSDCDAVWGIDGPPLWMKLFIVLAALVCIAMWVAILAAGVC